MVIYESGDLEQALHHLENCQDHILDKLVLKETLGELHLKLKQYNLVIILYCFDCFCVSNGIVF